MLHSNDDIPTISRDAEQLLVWIKFRHDGAIPSDCIPFIQSKLGWDYDRALDAMAQLIAANLIVFEPTH